MRFGLWHYPSARLTQNTAPPGPPGLIADGPREREPQIRNSGEKAVGQSLIPLAEHGQSMAGHDSAGVSLKSMLGHSSIHSNSLLGYKNIPTPH